MGLGLLLALQGPALAVQTQSGSGQGVRVETRYSWPERIGQGFYPLHVQLENTSTSTRELHLRLEQSYGYNSTVDRTVVLEGGERLELDMVFPSFTEQAATATLYVTEQGAYLATLSGVGPSDRAPVAYRQFLMVGPTAMELEEELDWLERLAVADHNSVGAASFQDLPSEHVAFTSVDVVVLDARDELPTGDQLDGLLAWVRLGGTLMILGNPQGAHAHPQLDPWLQDRFAWQPYLQSGVMPGLLTWTMGRGTVSFLPPEDVDSELIVRSRVQQSSESPLARLLPAGTGAHNPGFSPTIPGVDALPRGLFALLVLLVAFLLGPVNALLVRFVLKRPALALLSTPVLAIGSTGTLVGVGLAHNGLGVRAARVTVTMLDQRAHRAAVHEVRQLYAGLSPGKGLRPSADAWAFPTDIDWAFQYEASYDKGLIVSGDMLPVRSPTRHVVISERAARQRLDLDGRTVSNSLGSTVQQLVLRADGGAWGLAAPLKAGGSAELVPLEDVDAHLAALWSSTSATSSANWPPRGHGLPEDSYVARLETSPFAETEGLDMREDFGEHWVIGVLAGDGESP